MVKFKIKATEFLPNAFFIPKCKGFDTDTKRSGALMVHRTVVGVLLFTEKTQWGKRIGL